MVRINANQAWEKFLPEEISKKSAKPNLATELAKKTLKKSRHTGRSSKKTKHLKESPISSSIALKTLKIEPNIKEEVSILKKDATIQDVEKYLEAWVAESPNVDENREVDKKNIIDFLKSLKTENPQTALRLESHVLPNILYIDLFSKNLKNLSINSNQIEDLPDSIPTLKMLENLTLSGCANLTKLPKSFKKLTHLKTLNIISCVKLTELPKGLSQLTVLNLAGCEKLTTSSLSRIDLSQNLTELNLSGCTGIITLPKGIGKLTKLVELNLFDTGLTMLPEEIGELTQLKSLRLAGSSNLQTLPESIGKLIHLEDLLLSRCSKLSVLPQAIGALKNLTQLNLSGCKELSQIPETIGNLSEIWSINLSGCSALFQLPAAMGNLPNLQEIDFNGCTKITALPSNASHKMIEAYLTKWVEENPDNPECEETKEAIVHYLESLNTNHPEISLSLTSDLLPNIFNTALLSDNIIQLKIENSDLTHLPESICDLTKLTRLDLSNCGELKGLPNPINQLNRLRELDLSGNMELIRLPQSVDQLTKLKIIDRYGYTLPAEASRLTLPRNADIDKVENYLNIWSAEGPQVEKADRAAAKEAIMSFLKDDKADTLTLLGNLSTLPHLFHINLLTKKLKNLSISKNNQVSELPRAICALAKLEKLDLSFCTQLSSLPDEIDRLESLKDLNLQGCILIEPNKNLRKHETEGKEPAIMKTAKILKESDSSVIYEVQAGKRAKDGSEERVVQESQKGGTCWYYTFNFLRKRVGKILDKQNTEGREIEKRVSEARKELTAYEEGRSWFFDINKNKEISSWLSQIDKTHAAELSTNDVEFNKEFNARRQKDKSDEQPSLMPEQMILRKYLKEFSERELPTTNFLEFVNYKLSAETFEIEARYLEKSHPGYIKSLQLLEKRLDPSDFLKAETDLIFLNQVAGDYKLQYAHWSPQDEIEDLVSQLKTTGPLAVYGRFGPSFYKEKPSLLNESAGKRHLYSWSQDAVPDSTGSSHVVLVIGAEQGVNDLESSVYFIDPNDKSDPNNPESQRIYKVSYTHFSETVEPVSPISLDTTASPPSLFKPYAYCGAPGN